MNEVYQLPPILQGTAEQQLRQLRDYLVRLSRQLPAQGNAQETAALVQRAVSAAKPKDADELAAVQARARQLKDLIVKTADDVYTDIKKITKALTWDFVADAERFGTYWEKIRLDVEETAKGTIENYEYESEVTLKQKIGQLDGSTAALEQYRQVIDAQIRRGFIQNPRHEEEGQPEYLFGIVISQKVSFESNTEEKEGETYYEISANQTFGFYTSTGWQYWIGGKQVGWFDSENESILHVANILVEDQLQFSADWLVTTDGGWGLRYIGG